MRRTKKATLDALPFQRRETLPNNSLDASGGSVVRIKRDPAKLLGSAVAQSTQTFGVSIAFNS